MINSKEIIKQYGLSPNKALGQNFLVDENALNSIVALSECADEQVFEIGPGLGVLTDMLAQTAKKVVSVEIDSAMVELLKKTLQAHENISIVHRDILKFKNDEISAYFNGSFIVCANLPYYITSQTAMKLIDHPFDIKRMVLMMQQEAAEHFTASTRDKCYTPVSVLSQRYYTVMERLQLSPSCYYPSPTVNSSVLLFERNAVPYDKGYSRLVKAAFSMRRKTLRNNLASLIQKELIPAVLESANLAPTCRAEELDFEQFSRLLDVIRAQGSDLI